MTEKQFTQTEINEITNKIYLEYLKHYQVDKMTFAELMLVENVIMRIQQLLDEELI